MNEWNQDSDNDGIPDVVEEAIEKASLMSRTFTKKNFYIFIFILILCATYGIGAWQYMSLRDEKIALQNQFDWQKSENEIEINKNKIEERRNEIIELNTEMIKKKNDINNTQIKIDDLITNMKEQNEDFNDEIQSMDSNDLKRAFSKLGYPTK